MPDVALIDIGCRASTAYEVARRIRATFPGRASSR